MRAHNNSTDSIAIDSFTVEVDDLAYYDGEAIGSASWHGPLRWSSPFQDPAGQGMVIGPGESAVTEPLPNDGAPLTDPDQGTFRVYDGRYRFTDDDVNAECLGGPDTSGTISVSDDVDLTEPTEIELYPSPAA